jgi:hypothetical protein
MDALKFIFSSFWVFIGLVILIAVILEGIADIVKQFKRK